MFLIEYYKHQFITAKTVSTIDQVSNSKSFCQMNIQFHRFYKWITIIIADSMKYHGQVWILLVELTIALSNQAIPSSQWIIPKMTFQG